MPLEDSTKLNGTLSQGQSLAAGLGPGPRLYGALVDRVPEIKPFLFVTGLASAAAFGSLAASNATPKTLALDGLSSGAGFGSPTVSVGILQTIDLTSLASGAGFGSPAVANVAQTLDLTALASGAAFGSPTIALFVQEITLDGLASGAAFGSPTVANVSQTLDLTGLAPAAAFGSITLADVETDITLDGLASAAAFGSPVLANIEQSLLPDSLTGSGAFGSATIANVFQSLLPSSVTGAATFGTLIIEIPSQPLAPSSVTGTAAFGSPTIASAVTTYEYYKIEALSNNSAGNARSYIWEIEGYESNDLTGTNVFYANYLSSAAKQDLNTDDKAFNGNHSNGALYWDSGAASSGDYQWIWVRLDTVKAIRSLRQYPRTTSNNQPGDIRISGSNNGSDWTTLKDVATSYANPLEVTDIQ
jgi:hypothetical protein